MLSVRGYMHVYATKFGEKIHQEQMTQVKASGLYYRSSDVTAVDVHPPDGKSFEGTTLERMWQDSQSGENYLVWYIHTKGASVGPERQASYKKIRNLLQAVVIDKWQHCMQQFEDDFTLDCYGAYLPTDNRYFYPGNMWWARSSHIRTLPSPRKWAEKSRAESIKLHPSNVRYGYEDWITLSSSVTQFADEWKPICLPRKTIAKAFGPWKP